jgi:serine phosphatase RsbU (regulator of sigma subunit)
MPNPKILIVDDEPFNVDYLEQELEDLHYETVSAANGQQALDLVRAECPDLILLDIMMPVMDGFEVLARLRADAATRDIPVIVISANSDLEHTVRGIQLGAEDYLPKPFEPTLLRARISSSLEKKHLRDLQGLYLKSLERELEIGREIQKGFLPRSLPRLDGWEIAAYFRSAHEVAGDFYDAFTLEEGEKLCLVIADVCDKGVGAALFMTLFRSLLRFTMSASDVFGERTVAERLDQAATLTNNYIEDTHGDTGMFATVFLGVLDPQTGCLAYINAGHESPVVVGSRGQTSLTRTGPALGMMQAASFRVREIQLERGDLFFAFTDGATDALDPAGERFERERLLPLVTADGPAAALLERVGMQLDAYAAGTEQFDDITLLAVRRCGSARPEQLLQPG